MKITLEGTSVHDLATKAQDFASAVLVKGVVTSKAATTSVNTNLNPMMKRKPGRPAKATSYLHPDNVAKKVMVEAVNEPSVQNDSEGNEWSARLDLNQSPVSPVVEAPVAVPAAKITKEDVQNVLQKLCETQGVLGVRNVLAKFGVSKLGELDEKRYHEILKSVEAML